MPDVFISYAATDSKLAKDFHAYMEESSLSVFLAEISIEGGAKWKDSIVEALGQSKWVFFLATPASCASIAVMHEIGGAIFGRKKLITILSGIKAAQLPAWIKDTQAIDLSDKQAVATTIEHMAIEVRSDRLKTTLVVAGLFLGALALGGSNNNSQAG